MAGVAGRSGTNKGKDKPWSDALRLAAFREDPEGRRRLDKIAEQCVLAAESGELPAIKEIGDRLDGKPAQAIIGGDEEDPAIKVDAIDKRDIARALVPLLPPELLKALRLALESKGN